MSRRSLLILGLALLVLVVAVPLALSEPSEVERYNITEVDDNKVVIEATFDKNINRYFLDVSPHRNAESEILSVEGSTVRYSITVDEDDDRRRQFVNDESVFIKDYKLEYTGQKQNASVTISDELEPQYSSVNSTESELVMFADESHSYNETRGNTTIEIVSPYSSEINEIALEAAFSMSSRFEDEDDLILIYLIPNEETRWNGYAFGTGDDVQHIWVSSNDVYGIRSTVIHETVHAHQEYDSSDNMEWFNEGSAERLEGIIYTEEHTEYHSSVPRGDWFDESESEYESVEEIKLSEPNTWEQDVEYERGRKVAYLVDISLRHHTNGEYTIIDLIDWMNEQENVNYTEFRTEIVSHTDKEFGNRLDSYMGSRESIDVDDERFNIYFGNTSNTSVPDRWSPKNEDEATDTT